jgi:O-antigen/teichoic acid export membrane protein
MLNIRIQKTLLGGGIQQGLMLIAMPVIASFYGVAEIGIFAEQLSLGVLIGALLSLKIEVKLPLLSSKKSVFQIINAAVQFNVLCTFAILALFLLSGNGYFLPALCIASAVNLISVFSYQAIRNDKFGILAFSKVIIPVVFILLATVFSFVESFTGSGLVSLAYIFALMFSVMTFSPNFLNFRLFSVKQLLNIFHKNKENSIFTTISTVMDLLKDFLIISSVLRYFSAEMAGVYFLATKIFIAPATLIASSISQVLYKDLSDLVGKRLSITPHLKKQLNWSFMFGMAVILSTFVTINYFGHLFLTGELVKIQVLSLPLMVIVICIYSMTIISILVFVLNLQKSNVNFTFVYFLISFSPFAAGIAMKRELVDILLWQSYGLLGLSALYFYWILRKIKDYEKAVITHSSKK